MDLFWGVGGQRQAVAASLRPPTVTLLLERLKNARLQSDRREIIHELKEFTFSHQRELGEVGIPIFIRMLRSEDAQEDEITEGVLKIVLDIISEADGAPVEVSGGKPLTSAAIAEKNAGILLSDHRNVEVLLDLLRARELWTRLLTIQVLSSLLYSCPDKMEAAVLSCGAGMTRLIDVLEDPREEIRNELLLMLLKLTQSNTEIQNAVAFQEGFERLLHIVKREGIEDGGIIVCDCLKIMHNILRGNKLTQKLFLQGPGLRFVWNIANDLTEWEKGSIDTHRGLVTIPDDVMNDSTDHFDWSEHKRDTVLLCLEIISEFVRAGGFSVPKGMLEFLTTLAFVRSHVEAVVRIQAMSLLQAVMAHNADVHTEFSMLCCSVQTALIPASLLLIRHVIFVGTPLQPLNTLLPAVRTVSPQPTSLLSAFHQPDAIDTCDSECHAAFAVLVAYVSGNDAGRFGMIAHAITPPPPVSLGLPDDAIVPQSPVQLTANTLASYAGFIVNPSHSPPQSVAASDPSAYNLMSPFVDRMASLHQSLAVCRAAKVLRLVLGLDSDGKEFALRVQVGGKSLFDVLIGLLPTILQPHGVGTRLPLTLTQLVARLSLLRLIGSWFMACPSAVQKFLTDPANLFLFDLAAAALEPCFPDRTSLALSPTPSIPSPLPQPYASLSQDLSRLGAAWLIAVCFDSFAPEPPQPSSTGKRPQPQAFNTWITTSAGTKIDRSVLLRMITSRLGVQPLMDALSALSDCVKMVANQSSLSTATSHPPAQQSPQVAPALVMDTEWATSISSLQQSVQKRIFDVYAASGSEGGVSSPGVPHEVVTQLQQKLARQEAAMAALESTLQQQQLELKAAQSSAEQATTKLMSVEAEKRQLEAAVASLNAQLATQQSQHASQLELALERARADVEALMDVSQAVSTPSTRKHQPQLSSTERISECAIPSTTGKRILDFSVTSERSCDIPSMEDAPVLSPQSLFDGQSDTNASAVEQLQSLQLEHEELLVLVAMQDFSLKTFEDAIVKYGGKGVLEEAQTLASEMLEKFLEADDTSVEAATP